MHLGNVNDAWQVHCGRIHRDNALEMQRWCWETWGTGWGEYRCLMGVSVFIFSSSHQANWFIFRWQDHFKKIDKNP